jgi:hypothetical protein
MAKKKAIVVQRYSETDLIGVIYQHFESIQSPEGAHFNPYQVTNDTLILNIGTQSFIITITEKERLS